MLLTYQSLFNAREIGSIQRNATRQTISPQSSANRHASSILQNGPKCNRSQLHVFQKSWVMMASLINLQFSLWHETLASLSSSSIIHYPKITIQRHLLSSSIPIIRTCPRLNNSMSFYYTWSTGKQATAFYGIIIKLWQFDPLYYLWSSEYARMNVLVRNPISELVCQLFNHISRGFDAIFNNLRRKRYAYFHLDGVIRSATAIR